MHLFFFIKGNCISTIQFLLKSLYNVYLIPFTDEIKQRKVLFAVIKMENERRSGRQKKADSPKCKQKCEFDELSVSREGM